MKDLKISKIKNFKFIQKILNHPKVESLVIYGSRARGDHNEFSDLDLCIKGSQISEKDWSDLVLLAENNEETLIPIDLVHYEKIESTKLKANIDKEGVGLVCM